MSKALIILLFSILKAPDQNYTAQWVTGNENLIASYRIEQSLKDTLHFVSIKPIAKGKTSYEYRLPKKTAYYRIKAVGKVGKPDYYTPIIFMDVGNNVTLTNATKSTSYLTWITTNESNVDYYLIEKTSDGKTYSLTTKVPATGDAKYTYKFSKTVKIYRYRVTTWYKDKTFEKSITFK